MNTSRTFRLVVTVAVLCVFCALPVFAQQDRPRDGQQDRPSVEELVGQLTPLGYAGQALSQHFDSLRQH